MPTETIKRCTCDGCGKTVDHNGEATLPKGWIRLKVLIYAFEKTFNTDSVACSKRCAATALNKVSLIFDAPKKKAAKKKAVKFAKKIRRR